MKFKLLTILTLMMFTFFSFAQDQDCALLGNDWSKMIPIVKITKDLEYILCQKAGPGNFSFSSYNVIKKDLSTNSVKLFEAALPSIQQHGYGFILVPLNIKNEEVSQSVLETMAFVKMDEENMAITVRITATNFDQSVLVDIKEFLNHH